MIIRNVQVINADHTIGNAEITVNDHNGIIEAVNSVPGRIKANMIAIPGFIDVHLHGNGGYDVMDDGAIKMIAKNLAKQGTTAFMPTTITSGMDVLCAAIADMAKTELAINDAKMIGIHLEGPFISIGKKGAHDERYITNPTESKIQRFITAGQGKLKKITIAPEIFPIGLIRKIVENKITVSIGHTESDLVNFTHAVDEGATVVTHLWNAMTGVSNRNPGVVAGTLVDERVFAEIITDLAHVDLTTLSLTLKAKSRSKIIAVTDALAGTGLPEGNYKSGGLLVNKRGKLFFLDGTNTLAGSGWTMYDLFLILVNLNLPLQDIVAMTSTNAAMSEQLLLGAIKPGYPCDLIILNDDFTIKHVYINGKSVALD